MSAPEDWTFPAGGYPTLWIGKTSVTSEDLKALADYVAKVGGTAKPDLRTLEGTWSRSWACDYYDDYPTQYPLGGLGSTVYEHQKVDPLCQGDVNFAEESMFYLDAAGVYTKGIPPNSGAYHKDHEMGVSVEGPRPGSEAADILGDGRYTWNKVRQYWEVESR